MPSSRATQRNAVLAIVLGLGWVSFVGCGDDGPPSTLCNPDEQQTCYEGPVGTEGVGACRFGVQTCLASGDGFSACTSQILPSAENCGTALDDDCDGEVNEDCVCVPGTFQKCYGGPAGTVGVGICASGTQWCSEDGLGLDACQGEVLPTTEDCLTPADEDCDGVVNQPEACVCAPGDVAACYTGPDGTEGVGVCVAGTKTCLEEGGAFGPCVGDIVPGVESCATDEDDDCNGLSNEPAALCSCSAGETRSCYGGPTATRAVGICVAGTQSCDASGDGYGPCVGDVLPSSESCATPDDDDCDGEANEEAAGCECTPGDEELCYTGPRFTLNVGTCASGTRICSASGHWLLCEEEVVPVDDDCATPLDENCDGSVNEPSSGCFCFLEDVLTLESEDCVLDYGETAWKHTIIGMPHELAADQEGNAYMLLRHEVAEIDPEFFFEPVPLPLIASALVARHTPSGELFWGKELTGSVLPEVGYANSYNMSVAPDGMLAFTAPTAGSEPSAFGSDTWTWSTAFRLLYSVDPYGFPLFAVSLPRFAFEPNTALHAVAATGDGGVYYANGPQSSHLLRYDASGNLAFNLNLNLNLDDLALAPTDDGGVLFAFTTDVLVNFGTGNLLPLAGSTSDLVVVRFDQNGTALWAVRPMPAAAVLSARQEGGILAIVEQSSLIRLDVLDGSFVSLDPIPAANLPASSFAQVGVNGLVHSLLQSPTVDFGLGDIDPYGGLATGTFVALRAVGGTRWARSPLSDRVIVGGGPPNIVLAAFSATTEIDLDGTLVPLDEPTVFLTRLAY